MPSDDPAVAEAGQALLKPLIIIIPLGVHRYFGACRQKLRDYLTYLSVSSTSFDNDVQQHSLSSF